MRGMFQSSRIASGSFWRQAVSACSPSSASMIWKSRPSRMRRATLRMTLESSTTRQVLISASNSSRYEGTFAFPFLLFVSSRLRVRRHFEHAVDVEDDHELSVEAVDAAGELGHAGIEIDGVFLAAVVGELEHFADLVDQEPIG